ncbi:restriction endonuclease subunit S [Aeromonas veronii]|uniref:restriction endonuclease subunit S n=1 Tax=Aeromonas veronii TaxID=654 RepID=UPI001F3FC8DF|nr:restriction endonuclease subunit S [Aeromonas veronii]
MAALKIENLITDNLDLWTAAVRPKSSAGRGSNSKLELTGIKKLRELILELAVRGKLVPQDPSDEPASVLLERIAAEKTRLVKEGKIKKPKALPEIGEEDKPFELPEGWECIRLGDLTSKMGSGSTPRGGQSAYVSEGIPFLRSQNVWNEGLRLDDVVYIDENTHLKMEGTKVIPGDVLLNITGASLGRTLIFPDSIKEANVSQHVTIIRLLIDELAPFVHLGIKSPLVQDLIWGRQVGMAIEGLSKRTLELFEFPIPPLAEQQRIVAKVDELMVLCDQLEQRCESQLAAHQTLVETLLATLTDSCDADELAQNWARLSTHFDTLFTTEASIDALKQTILQLAVMGRLVPFGSNTEKGDLKKFLSFGPRNGFSPKEVKSDTGVKVLKLGATSYGSLDLNESKSIDVEIERESNLWLNKGDILIQRGNSANYVGCNCLVEEDVPGVIYPDLMMKIRPLDIASSEYLSMWLSSPMAREFMWSRMTGTSGTMPKISKKVVESIPVVMPSRQTQDSIVAKAQDLLSICEHLKQRLRDIQQTQLQLTDTIVGQVV